MSVQQYGIDSDEIIQPTSFKKARKQLSIFLPLNQLERRVYLYLEVSQAVDGTAFTLIANLKFMRLKSMVGPAIPVGIAILDATANASQPTFLNSGGSPVADSINLHLAQPFDAAVTNVVIQPMRFNVEADELVLDIEKKTGDVVGFRAFLACASTKYS